MTNIMVYLDDTLSNISIGLLSITNIDMFMILYLKFLSLQITNIIDLFVSIPSNGVMSLFIHYLMIVILQHLAESNFIFLITYLYIFNFTHL